MKHVVILGARGMLGTDLMDACAKAAIPATGLDLPEIDIARAQDLAGIPDCDWVVNCAAFTRVDDAESHQDQAFAVNRDGTRNVADLCARRNTPLLHISTDHVFDGKLTRPYREDDRPNPVNAYGASKLAGEAAVAASGARHIIVRTQALFGAHGRSFVNAVVNRVREQKPLRVVNDQRTCPTWTVHLAEAILNLLRCGKYGIVHVSASGSCTWFEFAEAIVRAAGLDCAIEPITSAEYRAPASRPAYSVLDKARYVSWTGREMPPWKDGLAGMVAPI